MARTTALFCAVTICDPLSDGSRKLAPKKNASQQRCKPNTSLPAAKPAARRQRITLGAVTFGLVVAIALAALAFYKRNLADERRRQARARELTSEARLAISSPADGLQRSTLLAIESLNSAWTLDGFIACVDAISRLPRLVRVRTTGRCSRWPSAKTTGGSRVRV